MYSIRAYIKQLKIYIKRPISLFDNWAETGRLNWMPDKWYLSLMFRSKMGYWMNWKSPKTFNEKLQWLKIHDRNPFYTKLVDKYEVRKYIAEKLGEEYSIPLLGVWDTFDEIDFEKLPNQFVLKCTHDSGSTIVCKNKNHFDYNSAKIKLSQNLARNYYYSEREWPYKKVHPKIIAEKYMEDENGELRDYKFFCFDGKVKYLQVDYDRFTEHHRNIYDPDWNLLPFSIQYPSKKDTVIKKPETLNTMIDIATRLSQNMPHVRVDLYNTNGKIYFGELTFYHGAGFEHFTPNSWNEKIGKLLKISTRKRNKSNFIQQQSNIDFL